MEESLAGCLRRKTNDALDEYRVKAKASTGAIAEMKRLELEREIVRVRGTFSIIDIVGFLPSLAAKGDDRYELAMWAGEKGDESVHCKAVRAVGQELVDALKAPPYRLRAHLNDVDKTVMTGVDEWRIVSSIQLVIGW